MSNPILRMLLWILVAAIWVNVALAIPTYGTVPGYLIWPGVLLTALMVWTSERGRRWMS